MMNELINKSKNSFMLLLLCLSYFSTYCQTVGDTIRVAQLPVKNGYIIPINNSAGKIINYSDQVIILSINDTVCSLFSGKVINHFLIDTAYFLLIKDSSESVTCYGNLRGTEVKDGQSIKKGDIIGFSCHSKERPNLFELKFFFAKREGLLSYFELIDFFKRR